MLAYSKSGKLKTCSMGKWKWRKWPQASVETSEIAKVCLKVHLFFLKHEKMKNIQNMLVLLSPLLLEACFERLQFKKTPFETTDFVTHALKKIVRNPIMTKWCDVVNEWLKQKEKMSQFWRSRGLGGLFPSLFLLQLPLFPWKRSKETQKTYYNLLFSLFWWKSKLEKEELDSSPAFSGFSSTQRLYWPL